MSSASTRPSDTNQGSGSTPAKGQSAKGNNKENDKGNDDVNVREDFQTLVTDVGTSIHTYCEKRPEMAGLMIFALGIYVGWKIKPW